MATPIYKLYQGQMREAWYQLSSQEQNAILKKVEDAQEQAGGKTIVMCRSRWSGDRYEFFGVEEFPDLDAVIKHHELLDAVDWFRYIDGVSTLGVKWE